jgi:hypothetical protein
LIEIVVMSTRSVRSVGMNFLTGALAVSGNANQIVISVLNVTTGLMMNVAVLSVTIYLSMIGVLLFNVLRDVFLLS